MGRVLRSAIRQLFHRSGGVRLVRREKRGGVRIFLYHRFTDASLLKTQCAYLREYYEVLSMGKFSEYMQSEQPPPANSVVITIDDGYRDFVKVAFPIFSTYGIPVTVFLVTDFLDKKLWLWPDVVKYALEHTPHTRAEVEIPNGVHLSLPLDCFELRLEAARMIIEEAKKLTNADRLLFLQYLTE